MKEVFWLIRGYRKSVEEICMCKCPVQHKSREKFLMIKFLPHVVEDISVMIQRQRNNVSYLDKLYRNRTQQKVFHAVATKRNILLPDFLK